MNREDYIEEIVSLAKTKKNLLIQWPTGVGKTRGALEIIKEYCLSLEETGVVFPRFLVVIPKLVLIDNWKKEIIKWLGEYAVSLFKFTTYVSFYKYMDTVWDCIVFDEGHHFTERCAEAFIPRFSRRTLVLSATIKKEPRQRLFASIPGLWFHKVSTRKVIEEEILPDPSVFLIPLRLEQVEGTFTYVKNPKGSGKLKINYASRWMFSKRKEKIEILCTAQQCHALFCDDVKYWENQFRRTQQPWAKNKWLHLAGERLKWLSEMKTPLIKEILKQLKNCRTLTFCSTIEQAEELGKNTIHSKTKEGVENLRKFNEGIEKHITSVNVLNEGINLSSCQVGVFAGLTASETAQLQKLGRILRHRNPLLILPYFAGTRDEEIVDKMKVNYNPKLIKTVALNDIINEIQIFLKNENAD